MHFVYQHRQDYPTSLLFAAMDTARSAYYRWLGAAVAAESTPAVVEDQPVEDDTPAIPQRVTQLILQRFHYLRTSLRRYAVHGSRTTGLRLPGK